MHSGPESYVWANPIWMRSALGRVLKPLGLLRHRAENGVSCQSLGAPETARSRGASVILGSILSLHASRGRLRLHDQLTTEDRRGIRSLFAKSIKEVGRTSPTVKVHWENIYIRRCQASPFSLNASPVCGASRWYQKVNGCHLAARNRFHAC